MVLLSRFRPGLKDFLSRDFIYPNIEVSVIYLLSEQTSLLDYLVFPLKGKEIFSINAQFIY